MNRLPTLDGIRACAVALVFLAHAGLERWVPGGLGVTVFFVMSGYLITGLLRTEYVQHGRLQLGCFYARRAVRLLPALLVVIAVAGLLAAGGHLGGGFTTGGLAAAIFYWSNYHLILHDFQGFPAGLGVLWSLAVEEQFYLLFPLWCAWTFPGFERRRQTMGYPFRNSSARSANVGSRLADPAVVGLVLFIAAMLLWRCLLLNEGAPTLWLSMSTDTRADAILAGCVLALVQHPELDHQRQRDAGRDGVVIAVCLGVLAGTLLWRSEVFRLTWRYTVQAVALLPLLHLAVTRSHWRVFRWLEAPPLVWLGQRSYGFYLVHQLVLLGLQRHWPAAAPWQLGTAGLLFSLVTAATLFAVVEQPLSRWYRYRAGMLAPSMRSEVTAEPHGIAAEPVPENERISVCIATFQRPEQLGDLLEDLTRQQRLPDEVVVVDNDPAESGRSVVEARQVPATPYDLLYALQPRQNISLTRNRTVELARGTWLAFIDDDERAPPDWLARLVHGAHHFRADGVLGPVIPKLPGNAPVWVHRGRFHEWGRMATGSVVPANRLRFGNVLLRRSCLQQQPGPFDPAFGLTGGEDGDLLNRLRLRGARLVWCDEASVEEPVHATRLRFRWLWLRALRGGQDHARHFLNGRYGEVTLGRTVLFFFRAFAQFAASLLLAFATYFTGRHRAAHWLFRAAANLGKLSLLVGFHYREYAGARA